MTYLTKKKEWNKLIDYILTEKEPIGWDTEFDGVDFSGGDNCVNKSRLDVWSIALFDGGFHPRGYSTAVGYVLPAEAITYFSPVLTNPDLKKIAHNATVDIHTAFNSGVDVVGVIDTLGMFRWLYPGRMLYGLDVLGREFLDDSKFVKFKDLCSEPIFLEEDEEVKLCVCGEEDCRKRKLPMHLKYTVKQRVLVEQKERKIIPISEIGPLDPRWKTKEEYTAQDPVLSLCLYDFACRRLKKKNYDNPFRTLC